MHNGEEAVLCSRWAFGAALPRHLLYLHIMANPFISSHPIPSCAHLEFLPLEFDVFRAREHHEGAVLEHRVVTPCHEIARFEGKVRFAGRPRDLRTSANSDRIKVEQTRTQLTDLEIVPRVALQRISRSRSTLLAFERLE